MMNASSCMLRVKLALNLHCESTLSGVTTGLVLDFVDTKKEMTKLFCTLFVQSEKTSSEGYRTNDT